MEFWRGTASSLSIWKSVFLAYSREYAGFGNSAGKSLIDGCPEYGHLFVVLPLIPLKNTQGGAHHLAGVGVESGLHLGGDKLVQFLGQAYVARGHGAPQSQYRTFGQLCQTKF